MCDGKVVEFGDADDVLLRPHHPYTKKLVASLPVLERPEPTGPRPFGRPPRKGVRPPPAPPTTRRNSPPRRPRKESPCPASASTPSR